VLASSTKAKICANHLRNSGEDSQSGSQNDANCASLRGIRVVAFSMTGVFGRIKRSECQKKGVASEGERDAQPGIICT